MKSNYAIYNIEYQIETHLISSIINIKNHYYTPEFHIKIRNTLTNILIIYVQENIRH